MRGKMWLWILGILGAFATAQFWLPVVIVIVLVVVGLCMIYRFLVDGKGLIDFLRGKG